MHNNFHSMPSVASDLDYSMTAEGRDGEGMSDVILAVLLGVLLFSPVSQTLFLFSFGYIVEIPIIFMSIAAIVLRGSISAAFARKISMTTSLFFVGLLPFALIGAMNGFTFWDIYPDFRAMIILVAAIVTFGEMSFSRLRSFVLNTMFCSLLTWLTFIYLSESGYVSFRSEAAQSAKFFFPIYLVGAGSMLQIGNRIDFRVVFSIAAGVYIATHTSYRINFLVLGFFILGIMLNFLLSRRQPLVNFLLSFNIIAGLILIAPAVQDAFFGTHNLYNMLLEIARILESNGVSHDVVFQLLTKTANTLLAPHVSAGDDLYVTYAQNLLNFERFFIPHGIGQRASQGDPTIWYGHTLDNSVIFFNYHFSIFVMLGLVFIFARVSFNYVFQEANMLVFARIFVFGGCCFFLYFRAWPFASVDGAVSFAFVIAIAKHARQKRIAL